MKRTIIIGGMAAGCKAAARLKRVSPDSEVTIIEKNSLVSFGSCGMPFFASGDIDNFYDLTKTPYGMIRDADFFEFVKDINVLTECEVTSIDHDKKTVIYKNLKTGSDTSAEYDSLVIGTGASPFIPPIPLPDSDKISTFHNPFDAKKFRELAQTGKIGSVAIIGGGFIGCELAEATVSMWGIETHLIELCDRLLPKSYDKEMSLILEKQMASNDIDLRLSTKVSEIELSDEGNPVVVLDSNDSLNVDYVFLCVGVRPQTKLAESIGCDIGTLGGITVDEQLRTSVDGVWAGGDCIELKNLIDGSPAFFPLGSLANRQGRVIADAIAGRTTAFKGAIGTSSIQVFDLVSASAGLTEEEALKNHPNAKAVWGSWYDRPDYMPEYQNLFGKLVYDSVTLKVYGLQMAGKGEVTRYIDAFTAIAAREATVQDLIDFEHAYTPPHSGPMNPLNSLGATAFSQSIDGIKSINPMDVENFDGQVVDVRESAEAVGNPLARENRNISVADITLHIEEFDKSKSILIVCQKGPRAYETARLFINAGFSEVYYSGGGMQLTSVSI